MLIAFTVPNTDAFVFADRNWIRGQQRLLELGTMCNSNDIAHM